jgi:hypothetical protein
MKPIHAMSALVIVGLCLLAISFGWRSIVDSRGAWSDKQAKEHARLSGEGHQRMHEQAEGPAGKSKTHKEHPAKTSEESLDEIKERYRQSREELQQAQNRGATAALVFRVLGGICTLIGGAGYFVLRYKD